MLAFKTSSCAAHGHPELTIQLREAPRIPNLERILIDYVEGAVAAGTTFRAGQTIQLGWSTLRLCQRPDGTLGVEERVPVPRVEWTESVDRALADVWLQREVARSVGLDDQLAFPRQDQQLMVAPCAEGADAMLLTRLGGDDLPADFSGWTLSCAESHEHGDRDLWPLLAMAAVQPGLVQFLALPHGTTVLAVWDPRLRPHVFMDGVERAPSPGSYVAGLLAAR